MRLFILLLFLSFYFGQSTTIKAQESNHSGAIAMADAMRESGKIYVVVVTITVIFFGLLAYLISLDKKVSRLFKKVKNTKYNES